MGRRIAVFLLLLPILVLLSGLLWLRSALPPPAATRAVTGLGQPVRILRDARGIPTIEATSDRDAAFALGYVHAEDRLFQMDLGRRLGAGRLAEWFGAVAADRDRLMRTLGLARAAERQFTLLPPEVRADLESYAAGVNAYLRDRRRALTPEYYLLRARPEPWQAVDTLIIGKVMAWQLAGNYRSELLHAEVAERLKPTELPIVFPAYPKGSPTIVGELLPIYRTLPLERLLALMPQGDDPVRASNNWVVNGEHSTSGKPVLANDPHLGLEAPGFWYLARIVTPGRTIAGATVPGLSVVAVGHTERIAWGVTNTGGDVADLFIEKLDPSDSGKYLTPDGSQPFVTRAERILVRGAAPVDFVVRETRHGPVISDVAGPAQQAAKPGYALALQATYLMDGDRTPQAFWEINRARDWDSFRRALAKFDAPQQNFVYADVEGHIGFMAPARVPIRAKGDGETPVPGWTGDYDWTGYIPFDQLPQVLDPPAGRIVTANNKIVGDAYPYFLGRDWDLPYRAQRIESLLEQHKTSLEGSAAIQLDIYSPMAERLLPLMLQVQPTTPTARAALQRLRNWDHRMDRDKVEPLLFSAWLREFNRMVLANKLGPAFNDYWGLHPETIALILSQHPEWCADMNNPTAPETCADQLAAALDRALEELASRYGADMNRWRWGLAHPAEFRHPLLSRIPVFDRLVALSIPADGGIYTLNRGGFSVSNPETPYRDVHGPGLRMIVDLAEPGAARFMVVPGQSGNPVSPHYGDLVEPWRDGYGLALEGAPALGVELLVPR